MPRTLERELIHSGGPDGGRQSYCISGAYVEATDQNVSISLSHVPADCGGCMWGWTFPTCPDCGGRIILGNKGPACAPGALSCRKCGSRFADMRYHAQEPGLHMSEKREAQVA